TNSPTTTCRRHSSSSGRLLIRAVGQLVPLDRLSLNPLLLRPNRAIPIDMRIPPTRERTPQHRRTSSLNHENSARGPSRSGPATCRVPAARALVLGMGRSGSSRAGGGLLLLVPHPLYYQSSKTSFLPNPFCLWR